MAEARVLVTSCILIRTEDDHWTVQVLSGQRWQAELNGLSPAINTACLAVALRICSVYSLVAGLQADVQHLNLWSLPMQKGCRKTHKLACCLPVTFHDLGWQQPTSHSRTNTEKRQVMPSRFACPFKGFGPFCCPRGFPQFWLPLARDPFRGPGTFTEIHKTP